MNIFEIVGNESKTKTFLAEGWYDLTESQRTYLSSFEQELWPLMESLVKIFEQRLKSQQIEKIFSTAEENFKGKKTGLGKAAKVSGDTAKKINQFLDKQGKKLQVTEPVKNFDQKAEKLKQQIKDKLGSDSKVVQQANKYANWAKENPGKTAFVIGVLTAASAFAGGPAGGAAVGFLLRSANEIIKGESASTAMGKAAKTAAIGGLVGAGLDGIGDALSGGLESVALEQYPNIKIAEFDYVSRQNGVIDAKLDVQAYGRVEDVDFIQQKYDASVDALRANDFDAFDEQWSELKDKIAELNSIDYMIEIAEDQDQAETWLERTEKFDQATDAIAATAQAAAQEKSNTEESVNEASKDVARRAGEKTKKAAQGAAKQATQKVTKRKLMKAWQKQGKPLDTGSIVNILKDAGLSADDISDLGVDVGVRLGKPKEELDKGDVATASDGEEYEWKGAQWVNKKTGRVAKKEIGKKLTQRFKTKSDSSESNNVDLNSLAQNIRNSDLANKTIQYLKSN
jgi:hypothetical protein